MENKAKFTVNRDTLEVRMERVFDAPRDLVWRVITNPTLIPQWWGPSQYKTVVDKFDFKVGGVWRYVHKVNEGEYAFNGVYKEIVPNEKIVDTFEFEPMPGHILTETMTLTDLPDGKTQFKQVSKYATIEDLEGMVASGMESGATETVERLDKLLKSQK